MGCWSDYGLGAQHGFVGSVGARVLDGDTLAPDSVDLVDIHCCGRRFHFYGGRRFLKDGALLPQPLGPSIDCCDLLREFPLVHQTFVFHASMLAVDAVGEEVRDTANATLHNHFDTEHLTCQDP